MRATRRDERRRTSSSAAGSNLAPGGCKQVVHNSSCHRQRAPHTRPLSRFALAAVLAVLAVFATASALSLPVHLCVCVRVSVYMHGGKRGGGVGCCSVH